MSGALRTKHRNARFVCHHDVTDNDAPGADFAQDADRERRILGRVARQAVEPDGAWADAAGRQPLRHVKAVAITADDHQGRQSPSIECCGAIRPFLGLAAEDDDGIDWLKRHPFGKKIARRLVQSDIGGQQRQRGHT